MYDKLPGTNQGPRRRNLGQLTADQDTYEGQNKARKTASTN